MSKFYPSMRIIAINSNAAPFKRLYDEGKMAIIQGVGYPNSSRSHFRAMDIWHTAEPDRVGNEGWLGQAVRALDPNSENVLLGVNIGYGLPRAMAVPGVPNYVYRRHRRIWCHDPNGTGSASQQISGNVYIDLQPGHRHGTGQRIHRQNWNRHTQGR